MLQTLICCKTSGHTAAWTSLYLPMNSGFSFTICAIRRPGFFCRADSSADADADADTDSRLVGLAGPSGFGEVGDHSMVGWLGSLVTGRDGHGGDERISSFVGGEAACAERRRSDYLFPPLK